MSVKFVKSHIKNDNYFDKVYEMFKGLSKHDFNLSDMFQYALDLSTGSYLIKIKVCQKKDELSDTKVVVIVHRIHLAGASVHSDISKIKYYNIGECLGCAVHHYKYALSEIYDKIRNDIAYYTLIANSDN